MGFIEDWKNGESSLGRWLAETATGSIVKVSAGAGLAYGVDHIGNGVPGWLAAMIVVAVPVAINWLNPADNRYGEVK
mgnify:CR=1